jgi:hypothetical protein
VTRGHALDPSPGNATRDGLLELAAENHAVGLSVGRPEPRVDLPLPIRLHGLNPRWSAGMHLERGYVQGHYGDANSRYRDLGFDREGTVWAPLFPDYAAETVVRIGNPVVCDHEDVFIQVTRLDAGTSPSSWHVSANNPTDQELRVTFRSNLGLPGLLREAMTVTLAPGGYVVLQ